MGGGSRDPLGGASKVVNRHASVEPLIRGEVMVSEPVKQGRNVEAKLANGKFCYVSLSKSGANNSAFSSPEQ